jgi:bifunctional non-homologous end joining protein LigD
MHHQAAGAVVLYAFDLLHRDGTDFVRKPIEERRAALAEAAQGSSLLLSEALPGTPRQIESAVRTLGLERVVAKRRGSQYEPGKRSDAGIKVKFNRRQELVVGGYRRAHPVSIRCSSATTRAAA